MEPFFSLTQEPKARTEKLWGIAVFDFGIPTGKTCIWKTPWCSKLCYGPVSRAATLPKARPSWLRRLRLVENASPSMFYAHIKAAAEYGVPIRLGRFGDVASPEVAEACAKALLEVKVPFMWPTRAWQDPTGSVWKVLDHYLPGQIICSMDEWLAERAIVPPAGYPISYIATRNSGLYADPVNRLGYVTEWCPHYPHPEMELYEKACYNCTQCGLCYKPAGSRDKRPNIVYLQHKSKGATRAPTGRKHYPTGHFTKQYAKGRHWYKQGVDGLEDSSVYTTCGIWTPDGWYNPDDDA